MDGLFERVRRRLSKSFVDKSADNRENRNLFFACFMFAKLHNRTAFIYDEKKQTPEKGEPNTRHSLRFQREQVHELADRHSLKCHLVDVQRTNSLQRGKEEQNQHDEISAFDVETRVPPLDRLGSIRSHWLQTFSQLPVRVQIRVWDDPAGTPTQPAHAQPVSA
jgi:hypothetical protein